MRFIPIHKKQTHRKVGSEEQIVGSDESGNSCYGCHPAEGYYYELKYGISCGCICVHLGRFLGCLVEKDCQASPTNCRKATYAKPQACLGENIGKCDYCNSREGAAREYPPKQVPKFFPNKPEYLFHYGSPKVLYLLYYINSILSNN